MDATPALNAAKTLAKDLPGLAADAQAIDPAAAQQLASKALIASKSPWGTVAAAGIGWGAAKLGLTCAAGVVSASCWTPDTVNLVAGFAAIGGAWVGAYVMRWVTSKPIAGLLSVPKS